MNIASGLETTLGLLKKLFVRLNSVGKERYFEVALKMGIERERASEKGKKEAESGKRRRKRRGEREDKRIVRSRRRRQA